MKFFIYTILIALASIANAQETPSSETSIEMSAMDLIEKGGFIMYPLAAISLVTLILIFLYFITIRRNSVVSNRFMTSAEALIRKHDYLGLVSQCQRQSKSIARIAEKTLGFMTKNSGVSFAEVREVAEAEGSRQTGILTQRISYLSDIGAIAPMVGLLGTVIGMIQAFMEIGNGNFEGVKQMGLGAGISEALITTASGLVIGITALVFYSFFRGRVQKYIAELEAATTHLMAILAAQYNRRGGATPQHSYESSPAIDENYTMPVRKTHSDAPSPIEEHRPDIQGI